MNPRASFHVKNNTAIDRSYTIGETGGGFIAAGASLYVTDGIDSRADLEVAMQRGLLQLTGAPAGFNLTSSEPTPAGQLLVYAGQPADGNTVTLTIVNNGVTSVVVFEADSNSAVTAGNIAYTIGGSVTATAQNLQTAVAANAICQAAFLIVRDILVINGSTDVEAFFTILNTSQTAGATAPAAATFTVAENGANTSFTAVTAGVEAPVRNFKAKIAATGATVKVFTPLFAITHFSIQVFTAAGVPKAWDGLLNISGGAIYLSSGSGSVPIASTDLVYITAAGN